jgi:glycosyltransferase involved in cell wall biosynthesis
MHIAVDGGTWMNERGYGRFTRELLTAATALPSAHRFTLVVDSTVPDEAVPAFPCARVQLDTPPDRAASASGSRSLRDLWAMSRALSAQAADCVLFPSVYTYVPLATRRPIVVCIHDVIAERYPGHVFATKHARLFWTLKTHVALLQAARIVTVSQHARDGIARQFRLSPDDIRIVPEAPAACFRPDADTARAYEALAAAGVPADAPFVLYVGGIAPHKNLLGLVDAVAALRREPRFANLQLVIVGDYARDVFLSAYPTVRAHIDATNLGGMVFAGRLDDLVVAGLMRLTEALVLPSFDEGFGLPAIEAAACGAPVIVTRQSAMPDMLGDAAVYFEPEEPGALERSLRALLSDDRRRVALGTKAATRAREHTWAAAARALLSVFDELGDAGRATPRT